MSDKLPDNVISFTTLKIDRSKKKHCECYDYNRVWPQYVVDTKNREITCNLCGNVIDAFDAMYMICVRGQRLHEDVKHLYDQAKEIEKYKPWLKAAREYERELRGGYIPSCPYCHEAILPEEIEWTDKKRELQRRKFKEGRKSGCENG